ncbi:MAG TPA: single-stranded DNA-binding protein [Planctomycetota bacterium]|jgi:single-strand DNA-binding protein|nr:single-stranded DNA-binding protein [Planctomycetota bacterium]
MASYNKVILMGNLTRDPELRFTANNMAICKFGLAVNRRFKDGASGEWKEEPTFVDITIFGARAEPFAKYHTKGKPAFIEGSLRLDTWDDKNGGGKRSKLYVVADNWEFVGGGGGGGAGGGGGGGRGERSASPGEGADAGASAPEREPEFQQVDDTPF